jgi:hypothetical protein
MLKLEFPQVAVNNVIKQEYIDTYNRSFDRNDINAIIDLCKKNDLQAVVNYANVRKIYAYEDQATYYDRVELHTELLEAVAATNNINLFKFIHKKLCTDHRYYCLKDINIDNQEIQEYKQKYLNKVKDNYE